MPSEPQFLASRGAAEIAAIRPGRSTAYRAAAESGTEALALYELNISLSNRFPEALSGLEVVLPNAVSTAVASRPRPGRRRDFANLES